MSLTEKPVQISQSMGWILYINLVMVEGKCSLLDCIGPLIMAVTNLVRFSVALKKWYRGLERHTFRSETIFGY